MARAPSGFRFSGQHWSPVVPCKSPRVMFPPAPGARKKRWRDSPAFEGQQGTQIPCGKCLQCRLFKASEWSLRLMCEAKSHWRDGILHAMMLTLTYNDANLPRRGEIIGGELDRRHVQLFMKRLRKHFRDHKIRFFGCGEYGTRGTLRAHYHIIIFGVLFDDAIQTGESESGRPVFGSKTLDTLWGMADEGRCTISELTEKSAEYVARYTLKKQGGMARDEELARPNRDTGEIIYVRRPFIFMSTGGGRKGAESAGGIGYQWFREFQSDAFPSGYLIDADRRKRPVPQYFKRKFNEETQARTDARGGLLNVERMRYDDAMRRRGREFREAHAEDFTPERLEVREEVRRLRVERLKRV